MYYQCSYIKEGRPMKKKKLSYENADLEILKLWTADIITTSNPDSPFDPEGDMDDAWT